MKKFRFSLEKILSLREFEESQAQIELAKAISVVTDLNNKLKEIAFQRVKNTESMANSSDLCFLYSVEKYIENLDYQKEKLLEELVNAELVLEQKREIMIEAMKKRKAQEKLKENQYEEYKKEVLRQEEKILDEINNKMNNA